MEDSVTSTFEGCSVIFRNVKEYYSSEDLIECSFSVRENCAILEPSNCYVGLFHVGWETLSSCVTKKSLTLIECLENGLYFVKFEPSETPVANADEFFQFCFYNIRTEVVFGASCPFQICEVKQMESFIQISSDLVSKSDSDWWISGGASPIDEDLSDTVVVHNKTTILEESLAKTVEENELLKLATAKRENEIKDYELNTKSEITDLKQEIFILQERESILHGNVADSQRMVNCLNENMEKMRAAIIAEYEGKITELKESNNFIMEKLKCEVNEKEVVVHKLSDVNILFERNEEIIEAQKRNIDNISSHCKALESKLVLERETKNILEFNEQALKSQLEILKGDENEVVEDLKKNTADLQLKLDYEKKLHAELMQEVNDLSTILEQSTAEIKSNDQNFQKEKLKMLNALQEKDDLISKMTEETRDTRDKMITLEIKSKEIEKNYETVIANHSAKTSELEALIDSQKDQFIEETMALQQQIQLREKDMKCLQDALDTAESEVANYKSTLQNDKELAQRKIEDLTNKLTETEDLISEIKSEKSSNLQSLDVGARHALQVANAHMQRQLRSLKKEKDTYQKLYNEQSLSTTTEEVLKKENAEMKLRLCMGKKAYEEKYKEWQKLKIQVQRLESTQRKDTLDSCLKINVGIQAEQNEKKDHKDYLQYLQSENERYAKKCSKLQQEIKDYREHETIMFGDIEQVKKNSKKLADHYESKMKLLEEENSMLTKQKDAWLRGTSLIQTQDDVIEKQPVVKSKHVIYHPPSVIEHQPHAEKIMYPPSFNVLGDKVTKAWLPAAVTKDPTKSKASGFSTIPVQEPCPQVMPSRDTKDVSTILNTTNNLNPRGKHSALHQPSFRCPVCQEEFPPGFSNTSATEHVNDHFNDQ